MGIFRRTKSPFPREFLLGRGNVQKRPRQDTQRPSNITRPMKRSRKDSFGPSLARNEEVKVEDAHSDIDEGEDYGGSGRVTLKTFNGPLTVDYLVAFVVQQLLFDGPDHPLYAGHMDAIIDQCDGGSIAESGHQLQRMCEFIYAQASELEMVRKGSQSQDEVRTVWAKKQGQALAEQVKGTSAFPDVISAMVMAEAQHHSSSVKIKDILRAVEDRCECDKQAQAPVGEGNVPQASAGPETLDEHRSLPYHPNLDLPAATASELNATYRPLSASTFSTGEPPNGSKIASSDPGKKQSAVQNSNGAVGPVNSRSGYGYPLENWIVKPAVKVEEPEEDGDGAASPTSADGVFSGRKSFSHELEQTVPSDCIFLGPFPFKTQNGTVANALKFTFQSFGFIETKKLSGRRWLVRLRSSKAARDAASYTFKIVKEDFKTRLNVDPQTFIATVPIDTNMSHLLTNISTLYKKSFSLQYSDQSPFSFIMVLTLSERILVRNFPLYHRGNRVIFSSELQVPAGPLHSVQAPPQAQP
ncbi:hypothetical protein KC345_g2673 [Hortaea werneckii]|nr:hypothetical protein KC345_g2673 [Hortaea werneckii]